MVFRRPVAIVNMASFEYAPTWSSNYLFIPKKLWLRQERRMLTFSEILKSGIGRFLFSQEYEKLNIEVINNTQDEITALAVEMEQRLKGEYRDSQEGEDLQKSFWSLFKFNDMNGLFRSRIGAEFLRQNRELVR
jgi:putative glycosyltransferase (TIGR04372 family)